MIYDLSGIWEAKLSDGSRRPVNLPGTLDENGIGPAQEASATRFTRKHAYEGEVCFSKQIKWMPPQGKRVFLEVQRARSLKAKVDDKIIEPISGTLSTPYLFELTGLLKGDQEITLLSDNTYPGLPKGDILYSSAATEETQTNWNGLLGYVRLRVEEPVYLAAVRVYPQTDHTLQAVIEIDAATQWQGVVQLQSKALKETAALSITAPKGRTTYRFEGLAMTQQVDFWDEYEGNLYEAIVWAEGLESKSVTFGVRTFGGNEQGRLALNGRTIFLRSEANCAAFPEWGYSPVEVAQWRTILAAYQAYGINCVRFHSHCPPEAAFEAADQLGILMQPELSCWNPKDAFLSQERVAYYEKELREILLTLANHPSFVMLTFGNELITTEEGHEQMRAMLRMAHEIDRTRLIADGSNNHYGAVGCEQESDFYASQKYYDGCLRGTYANMEGYINHEYPNAQHHYSEVMQELRKTYAKPVFSFEVGQFEILPDFEELGLFQGVCLPQNLQMIQKRVEESGLQSEWKRYVEATGELSRICYREEIEAVLRTPQMSGISLLGLQDFPGQGTALVGMMNSHMQPKPYPFARPERFRSFFCQQTLLVLLERYTYENTECLQAEVVCANYGKGDLTGALCYELVAEEDGTVIAAKAAQEKTRFPQGELTKAGEISIKLAQIEKPMQLVLKVWLDDSQVNNQYPVWVYPNVTPICPAQALETRRFDEKAREVLQQGGTVYLSPASTKEALPSSIQAQFTPDFWSVGTFAQQEGAMGQLIAAEHPLFRDFPTQTYTNWQWWAMAGQRAAILPQKYETIITEMDSYAYLRPMTQLMECRCLKGRLLFSTLGLQDLQQYPECRALQNSIYRYLCSPEFAPTQEIDPEILAGLVTA